MSDTVGGSYLPQTPARPIGSLPEQQFEYVGRLGPLYWLFIKNILLSSITFGIYRFWGRTNIRRYIWSNTRFMGDAFEYTGRGGELFIGFLIVFGVFVGTSIAIELIALVLGPESPIVAMFDIVFPIFIGYFIFVAQYAAQHYRLSRTVWRGLRGGMTGSAWNYGFYAFGVTLLTGLTLTLARPWARARLIERRLSNSYFGDAKVSIAFSSRLLYPSYIAGLAAFIVGAAILAFVVYSALNGAGLFGRLAELFMAGREHSGDEAATVKLVFLIVGLYFGAIILLLLYATVCFAWFDAATARATAENSTFQDLHFASSATGGQIAWLVVTNILLMLLTLTLAYPIVIQRTLRFITTHCHVLGVLDVERLRQNTLVKSRTGEGLLEMFDPGMF